MTAGYAHHLSITNRWEYTTCEQTSTCKQQAWQWRFRFPLRRSDKDRDLEGRIESINYQARTFVVEGKTFYADERTDYDDDLERFSDLRVGQRVEVDYVMRKGRRYAKEVELDD